MSARKCFICEQEDFNSGQELVHKNSSFHIYRCNSCGLLTTYPLPSKEELIRFYSEGDPVEDSWYDGKKMQNMQDQMVRQPTRSMQEIASYITDALPGQGVNFLDIGCNIGTNVELIQSLMPQWEFMGVELDPEAIEFCQQRNKFKLYTKTIEELDFQEKKIDCISILHVLEHVLDPVDFIRQMKKNLNTDGRVVVAVPNAENLFTKIIRIPKKLRNKEVYTSMSPPFHLHGFNLNNLQQLFENNGFRLEKSTSYHHEPYPGTYEKPKKESRSLGMFIGDALEGICNLAKDDCILASFRKID